MRELSWKGVVQMLLLIVALSIGITYSSLAGTLDRSAWFNSGGTMIATNGHLFTTITLGSVSHWTTYFAPTNQPITLAQAGDQIKVTWGFTPANTVSSSTGRPIRIGVINTPDANRLTTDGAPVNAKYAGYSTFICSPTLALFSPIGFAIRTNTTTESELFRAGWNGQFADWLEVTNRYSAPIGTNGVFYTLVMTLTRNASGGIDGVTTIMSSSGIINQISATDPAPKTFSFNTVCIFGDGNPGGLTCSFDTSQFQVEFKNVIIPVLQSTPKANGNIELVWNSLTNRVYQAQYKTNLFQASWNDMGGPITANNSTTTVTDLIGADPRKFYRVLLLP